MYLVAFILFLNFLALCLTMNVIRQLNDNVVYIANTYFKAITKKIVDKS
jgi:hypothetical protein